MSKHKLFLRREILTEESNEGKADPGVGRMTTHRLTHTHLPSIWLFVSGDPIGREEIAVFHSSVSGRKWMM
jgi:hypothetical protein